MSRALLAAALLVAVPPRVSLAASGPDLHGFVEARAFGWIHDGSGEDEGGPSVLGWARAELEAKAAVGGAHVTVSVRAQETTGRDTGRVLFDPLDRERRSSPIDLHEAYARIPLGPLVDLDVGRLGLGWGKTDGYSPSDSYLPRDLTEPFADEKIPITGARLRGQSGGLRYEAVAVPVTTPWRLPPLGGRYTPIAVPGTVLAEGEGEPPAPGFGAVRLLLTHGAWDLGGWARAGVRPAPVLVPRPDEAHVRPDGLVEVPLDRRFVHERALGAEVSRVLGSYVVRGEAAPVFSDDEELGDALLLAGGVERGWRAGTLLATLAGNARHENLAPALLLDRAFLPGVILAWSGDLDWGTYRLVLTQSFREGDGLMKAEVVHRVTDGWAVTYSTAIPYGSRAGALGALHDVAFLRFDVRRSF